MRTYHAQLNVPRVMQKTLHGTCQHPPMFHCTTFRGFASAALSFPLAASLAVAFMASERKSRTRVSPGLGRSGGVGRGHAGGGGSGAVICSSACGWLIWLGLITSELQITGQHAEEYAYFQICRVCDCELALSQGFERGFRPRR